MGAGAPGVRTSAEGADVQETAVGEGAAQVVEIIADHPSCLAEDWLPLFINPLRHRDVD